MKIMILLIILVMAHGIMAQGVKKDESGFEYFEMQDGDTTYIMKKYFFVMLMAGSSRSQSQEEAAKIQEGHMNHIRWMGEQGYIDLAGPVESTDEFRGILVFNLPSAEEVEKLVVMDPAVKAGRLVMKIYPWWSAKGGRLK